MKRRIAVAVILALVFEPLGYAQGKTLAATLNIYAFPNKGQTPEQQSQDETACYQFATQNSGVDPFALQKQAAQQQQQTAQATQEAAKAGQGAGVRGAVGGAAGGALIGAVAGDAGKGAAIGAGVGVVAGRRSGRRAEEKATQQAQQQGQQAQQATQQQMDNFKKAFSVCMEAKNYMVKF
jgi:hypothetical protein